MIKPPLPSPISNPGAPHPAPEGPRLLHLLTLCFPFSSVAPLSPEVASCDSLKCPAGQHCEVVEGEARCVADLAVTCRIQGDPHYTTFDGRRYDMMGTCTYTIAELCSEEGDLPAFSVEAKNEHRGSRRVSYVGYVTVRAYGHSVSLARGEVGLARVSVLP